MTKTIWTTFFLLTLAITLGYSQDSRPNVIFILTDDQRWDALGIAGNEIIQTPEMDKLASQGMLFTEAFVTTPICAASRASIVTGLYERSHEFTFRTPPISKRLARQTYPALLQEVGYKTGFVGKFGMQYQKDYEKKTFDFIHRPAEKGPWRGHYYRMTGEHTHKHISEEIGDASIEFIDSFVNLGPFCLSISFHSPHADDQFPSQYVYPKHLRELYRDVEIPAAPLSSAGYFDAQFPGVQEGLNYLRWLWRFDTYEDYQEKVKGYYRMITGVDLQLGRIRAALDSAGVAENTIIILMADNGYFLNERRLAGKWLMYENSLRVPFILHDPRDASIAGSSDEIVLNVDVAPTILKYADVEIPAGMQGLAIQDILKGSTSRDYFLCEHLFDHEKIPRSEGIRTKTGKYFRYLDQPDWEEYYDLNADPMEKVNLIGNETYFEEIDRLRALLDQEIREKTNH